MKLNAIGAAIYGALFLGLVLIFRFELPRYDYWDVVFRSTYVVIGDPGSVIAYLFRGNESMMAVPKLLIYLSNTLAPGSALLVEHAATLLLGAGSHVLLLRILRLPLVPGAGIEPATALRWWLVLLLFWWPAVLPTYTNTWFAVQYGLTLYFGLLAVHVYQRSDGRSGRLVLSYVAWLAAAMTHGTGLLLGPALAMVAALRDRRRRFAVLLFLGTVLVLWVQHLVSRGVAYNLQRFDSPLSLDSLKFMARAVTPPMWETALFVLVIAPLLVLTAWLYVRRRRSFVEKPYFVLILWGLAVWLSIWFARGGFQSHANPHYLRFFVVVYAAWAMMLFDFARPRLPASAAAWAGCALFLVVWLKGVDAGVSLAALYQDQIHAGAAVLRGESANRESLRYLYPDTEKLTGLFVPRLAGARGRMYGELVESGPRTGSETRNGK